MKNLKKILLVGALSVMTLVTLTGCGGSDDSAFDEEANITVMSREDGSGTRGAFTELVGVLQDDVDMTTVDAQITNSTSVMLTSVAGDEYAIGYVSLGSLNDTVKALTVEGVEATTDTILSGEYTLARPFNLAITEDNDDPTVADFLAYVMSPEAQVIVEEEGFVPSDSTEEYTSTNPSGTITVGGSTSVSPLMEKLVEAYNVINPDVSIEIQATGSSAGMENAISGTYDIGMASREVKDSELESGLVPTVLCMDGIAVVVNTSNPIEDIATEDIMNIFTGEYTTWADVAQ